MTKELTHRYRSERHTSTKTSQGMPERIFSSWILPCRYVCPFTVYIPVLAGMQLAPDTLEYGWQGVYNITTAFWANRRVLNYAQVKFSYMIEQIRALQDALESASVRLIGEVSDRYSLSAAHPVALTTAELASIESVFAANAWKATAEMNRLFHFLFFSYPDGYLDYWDEAGFHSGSLGYPVWWLEAGNYVDGPPPVTASAVQQQVRQRAQEALKEEGKREDVTAEQLLQRARQFVGMDGIDRGQHGDSFRRVTGRHRPRRHGCGHRCHSGRCCLSWPRRSRRRSDSCWP